MNKKLSIPIVWVGCAIIVFHLINTMIWWSNDSMVVHGCHSVWHEKLSLEARSLFQNPELSFDERIRLGFDLFKIDRYGYDLAMTNYSLVNYFLTTIYALSFSGVVKWCLIYAFLFFQYILVLLLIYALGVLIKNHAVGIWSMLIASFYPGFIGLSRKVNTALLTTASVVALVMFIQKERFRPYLWILPCVFFVVLGIVSSPLFFGYSIPLIVLLLIRLLFLRNDPVGWFLELVIFFGVVTLFFYGYIDGAHNDFFAKLTENFTEAFDKLTFKSDSFIGSAKEGLVESFLFATQDSVCPCTQTTDIGFNLKTFLFYGAELIRYTSLPLFVLGGISAMVFFFSSNIQKCHKYIFGVWFFGCYFFISMYHIKWGKFCAPLLPAIAVMSGFFIAEKLPSLRKLCKVCLLIFGIGLTLYVSYVPYPKTHVLEKLTEGLVSHRPLVSRNKVVARETSVALRKYLGEHKKPWRIGLLDKDSARFMDEHWVTDMSVRMGILISTNIPEYHTFDFYWSLDPETIQSISESDVICAVTHEKIEDPTVYFDSDGIIQSRIITYKAIRDDLYMYCLAIENLAK